MASHQKDGCQVEAEARGIGEKLGFDSPNGHVVMGMTKNQQGLGIGLGDKGKEKSSSTPKFGK